MISNLHTHMCLEETNRAWGEWYLWSTSRVLPFLNLLTWIRTNLLVYLHLTAISGTHVPTLGNNMIANLCTTMPSRLLHLRILGTQDSATTC